MKPKDYTGLCFVARNKNTGDIWTRTAADYARGVRTLTGKAMHPFDPRVGWELALKDGWRVARARIVEVDNATFKRVR